MNGLGKASRDFAALGEPEVQKAKKIVAVSKKNEYDSAPTVRNNGSSEMIEERPQ
jgi:hypothetical protein